MFEKIHWTEVLNIGLFKLGLHGKSLKNRDLDSHIHVISFLPAAILKHFISRAASQTNAPIFLPDFFKRPQTQHCRCLLPQPMVKRLYNT